MGVQFLKEELGVFFCVTGMKRRDSGSRREKPMTGYTTS